MPNNKNQHIVPQFYQKLFSCDNETIGKFVIKTKETDLRSSIKKTACENYYYEDKGSIQSKGQTIESSIGVIESGASIAIRKLIRDSETPLSPKENQFLYTFIGLQILRTKSFAKRTEDVSKDILKELNIQIQDINPNLMITKDVKPQVESLKHAASMTLSLLDLRCKILEISVSDTYFLTSDNPVSIFNPFLCRNGIYNQGPALVGTLIFLPISPVKGVLLYDSQIYKVGTMKRNIVNIKQKSDVDSLNLLACLNAYEELLFNQLNLSYFCFTNLIERVNKFRNFERKRHEPIYVSGTDSVFAYIPP